MEKFEARLKLTQAVMEAIRQGVTLDDIKKIFKMKCDHSPPGPWFIFLQPIVSLLFSYKSRTFML